MLEAEERIRSMENKMNDLESLAQRITETKAALHKS